MLEWSNRRAWKARELATVPWVRIPSSPSLKIKDGKIMINKKHLVIVESPTKAKTISKLLGTDYVSVATVGHFRDLPKKKLGIQIEDKKFIPEYEIPRTKDIQKVKKQLKEGKDNALNIFIATDPDREGEAIAWHVAEFLDLDKKEQNRIVFNEFTKQAVFDSISNPRQLDFNLINSQQARRLLDRIIGWQVSPVLWKKVKSKTSAGRVQSPVLQFVVEREEEIESFVSEDYWNISAKLQFENSEILAHLSDPNTKKQVRYRIFNKLKTEEILKILNNNDAIVSNLKNSENYKSPRPPFITSSLQQEASQKLGLSPDVTMNLAQQLFEGIELKGNNSIGLITYMRTDSFTITPTAMNNVRSYIKNEYGDKYLPPKPNFYKNNQRAQEAHECIRPTDVSVTPDKLKTLLVHSNDNLYRLYDLIWKRFVSSQMEKALYKVSKATIISNQKYKDENLVFNIENWTVLFDGYSVLYGEDREKSEDEIVSNFLFKDGSIIKIKDAILKYDKTKPPFRYTEAMLVRKMEQEGLGRPSTYANTIKTNLKTYLVKKNTRLQPTKLGRAISKFLKDNFATEVSPDYTTDMEEKLDKIALGEMDWQVLLNDFYEKLVNSISMAEKKERMPRESVEEYSDESCSECERPMIVRSSKSNGTRFLGCSGFPECKTAKPIIVELNYKCPRCSNAKLRELQGSKASVYYGCADYPNCKFNSRYEPAEGKCLNEECKAETLFMRGKSLRCEICKSFQKMPDSMKISK